MAAHRDLGATSRWRSATWSWASWLIVVGCVYPELSTSPDWDKTTPSGGVAGNVGQGGAGSGGKSSVTAGSETIGESGASTQAGEAGASADDGMLHAKLVDQFGAPIAGISLLVEDVEAVTDAQGEIVMPSPASPSFRAVLIDTPFKRVQVYEGLTRRDLYFRLPRIELEHTATLEGSVNADSTQNLNLMYVAPERYAYFAGLPEVGGFGPDVAFTVSLSWSGEPDLAGEMLGLNWTTTPPQNLPQTYYFGRKAQAIKVGDAITGFSLALSQIDVRSLEVQATSPAGTNRADFLSIGPFSLVVNTTGAAQQSYNVPTAAALQAAGLDMSFLISCVYTSGNSNVTVPIQADTDQVDETCPELPQLMSPPDGANDVSIDTPLVFVPERPGCNLVTLTHDGMWTVTINTAASQVTSPDLEPYGLIWGKPVVWQAGTISPCDSIDGFVMPPAPLQGARTTSVFSQSASRTFNPTP